MTSYTCTLYSLFLGDQETKSGWPRKGYTEAFIICPIFPRGTAITLGAHGYYTKYDLTGLTEYAVYEGDVIKDSFEKPYEVLSVKTWNNGDQFSFNELELEYNPSFSLPVSDERFFGFEDLAHGTDASRDVGMFQDGFQRGYWTEITY